MILPVYAYGHPVLNKKATDIKNISEEEIATLIDNMWDTMYNANGIGIAGPQVGKSLRIFVVDTLQIEKDDDTVGEGIKKVFINANIIEESGNEYEYEEGCLSIPHVKGKVTRLSEIKIQYQNVNGESITEEYSGMNARVIQHEYDHIEGELFTSKLKPIKKRRIQRRLQAIRIGNISTDYRMKFL